MEKMQGLSVCRNWHILVCILSSCFFKVVLHLPTDLVVNGHKVQAESWMGRMLPAVCGWVLFHGILGNKGSFLSSVS